MKKGLSRRNACFPRQPFCFCSIIPTAFGFCTETKDARPPRRRRTRPAASAAPEAAPFRRPSAGTPPWGVRFRTRGTPSAPCLLGPAAQGPAIKILPAAGRPRTLSPCGDVCARSRPGNGFSAARCQNGDPRTRAPARVGAVAPVLREGAVKIGSQTARSAGSRQILPAAQRGTRGRRHPSLRWYARPRSAFT